MIIDRLKIIAESLGLECPEVGDLSYQNLLDLPDDTDKDFEDRIKYFLPSFETMSGGASEFGGISDSKSKVNILFGVRSNLDDATSWFKYENHLKKLLPIVLKFLDSNIECDGYTLTAYNFDPGINIMDANLDGYFVQLEYELTSKYLRSLIDG